MNITELRDLIDRLDDIIYGSITEQATGLEVCKKLVALQSTLWDEIDSIDDAMTAVLAEQGA
jgi:hypothetical protein